VAHTSCVDNVRAPRTGTHVRLCFAGASGKARCARSKDRSTERTTAHGARTEGPWPRAPQSGGGHGGCSGANTDNNAKQVRTGALPVWLGRPRDAVSGGEGRGGQQLRSSTTSNQGNTLRPSSAATCCPPRPRGPFPVRGLWAQPGANGPLRALGANGVRQPSPGETHGSGRYGRGLGEVEGRWVKKNWIRTGVPRNPLCHREIKDPKLISDGPESMPDQRLRAYVVEKSYPGKADCQSSFF
jgi:hypothetical protein